MVTDGAAEEAGLLVGDYVHAVNGKDVTSAPHSEAADLARQGNLYRLFMQWILKVFGLTSRDLFLHSGINVHDS